LAIFVPSSHQRGALTGMVVGIIVLSLVKFGTAVAWPWLAVVGSITVFVSGMLASRLLNRPASVADDS